MKWFRQSRGFQRRLGPSANLCGSPIVSSAVRPQIAQTIVHLGSQIDALRMRSACDPQSSGLLPRVCVTARDCRADSTSLSKRTIGQLFAKRLGLTRWSNRNLEYRRVAASADPVRFQRNLSLRRPQDYPSRRAMRLLPFHISLKRGRSPPGRSRIQCPATDNRSGLKLSRGASRRGGGSRTDALKSTHPE
jgi:hypothetical protein